MFRDEQELNQAIERLPIDAQPRSAHRDALRAKMLAAFELAQRQPGVPPSRPARLGRILMHRTVRRVAVAAAILISTLGGFAWWTRLNTGVAFADVVKIVDTIRSGRFTITIAGAAEPVVIQMAVLDDRIRQELSGGIANVIDIKAGKILTTVPARKQAVLIDVLGLADASEQINHNWIAALREHLHGAGGNVQELGRRQIAGKDAKGFRADDDGRVLDLWVDAATGLPLEAEIPWGDGQTTMRVTDYEFNVPLDESLFALTAPEGYTLLQVMMNLQDTNEQDLVQLFQLLADSGGGCFPATLALGSLQYDLGRAESGLSPWQQFTLGGTVARAVVFLQTCHDPKYVGGDVELGQADRPVFWYRPKGSQAFRVIYGDLHVAEMPAEQLPAVPPPAPPSVPKVAELTPPDGAVDLPAGPMDLRIRFDRPMRQNYYAWSSPAAAFPDSTGRDRYDDARTVVKGASLRPDRWYCYGINGEDSIAFQSRSGLLVEPQEVSFATAPAADAPRLTAEQNQASLDALTAALRDKCPRLLDNLDWDALVRQYAPQLESCQGQASFAEVLRRMLANTAEPRLWLETNDQRIPMPLCTHWPNGWPSNLPQLVPGLEKRPNFGWGNRVVFAGRFDDGIGYLQIQGWQDTPERQAKLHEAMTRMADARGLVLDLRFERFEAGTLQERTEPAAGRAMTAARTFAGSFVDQPVLYARQVPYSDQAALPPQDLTVTPDSTYPHFRGPVVVLIGPRTGMTAEHVALMLKTLPGCTTLGSTTRGLAGTTEPLFLPNGVTVHLPATLLTRPDGIPLQKGIIPDREVPVSVADLQAGRDPVLQAALKLLRE